MHCSANQQITDNSFGWRIEEIAREPQHQPRHDLAADRWRLGFKRLPSPTGSANLPSAKELRDCRMAELVFQQQAAAEYDRAFAHVARYFMPFVLRAARIASGMRVLDIAAGTGLSAEAALSAVGPTGHVTAADVSPAMVEKARERLGEARNASVLVEDAQALSFSEETFDAVVCNLGLMFFPEPARGLAEFRRVLRPGTRAAVSVNTVPERSYNHQINVILTRYVPGLAEAVTRTFSLGEASRLEELFRECGFSQIEISTVRHTFVLPSFDAYYGPFERGGASTGQALAALRDDIRRVVRDEVRRDLGDTGGPIEVEAEYLIASGGR
jgi:ubiquinone/menaquinone biosynthesis C-methylase UbiE